MAEIIAMILSVAVDFQLPPNFVLAVAYNDDMSEIRAEWQNENSARMHAKNLHDTAWQCYRNTWWTVALWYQSGGGLKSKYASNGNIEYANGVIARYLELEGGRVNAFVGYTDEGGFY